MGKKSKKKNKDKKAKRCSKPSLTEDQIDDIPIEQKQHVESKINSQLATLKEQMNKLKRQENKEVQLVAATAPDQPLAPQAKRRKDLKITTPAPSSLLPVSTEEKKDLICEVCQTPFISESLLSNHMKSHKEKKIFHCTYCPVVCDNMPKLKRHMVTHTGERPYKCDICGKSFGLEWNMKLHKRTHTNEKPFKCVTCGKQFAQRTNLKLHGKSHGHQVDAGKPQESTQDIVYNLGSQLGELKPSDKSCNTQMTAYYRKKLEQYRQNLLQNKAQQNQQALVQQKKETVFRNQGGIIEHKSRHCWLQEMCQGIRAEISQDQSLKSDLSQQVSQLKELLDRDYSAELVQIQSYQGLLAKLFEMDQLRMDAMRIQILSCDRQEKLVMRSRRALGQYQLPDDLVQKYILEIKTEEGAAQQPRLSTFINPEIKQEQ